uniref:Uncharacterized protein n=1 Tax=Globodera rostochiensis TaxID=31243 RepID=A0A914I1D6_GLORO
MSVILARLDQCYAFLECKNGSIVNVEGHPILERNVRNVSCSGEQHYCAAVTCTRIGFSFILWACAVHNNKTYCADVFTKDARNLSGLKDINCDCEFGEFREELANVHFLPPELPTRAELGLQYISTLDISTLDFSTLDVSTLSF